MKVQIKKVGIKGDSFYLIEKVDEYYSLWVIEIVPDNLEEGTLQNFIFTHNTEGYSTSGSYQQIMDICLKCGVELMDL